jgi:hypothetical protein
MRATWCNIPEDILHSHCRENLKSYYWMKIVIQNVKEKETAYHILCKCKAVASKGLQISGIYFHGSR